MWSSRVRLISSITAASVVDLPEPVGPVTRTRPRGFVGEVLEDVRKAELLERLQLGGDEAEGGAQALALEVDVDAEAREARDRVRDVDLALVSKMLLLLGREDPVQHPLGVLGGEAREVLEPLELAVDADDRLGADRHMQVRGALTTTCSSRSSTEEAVRRSGRAAPARPPVRRLGSRLQRRFHGSSRPVLSAGNPHH